MSSSIIILTIAVLLALVISIFTGKHYYDSHRYIQLYYVAEDRLNAVMDDQQLMMMFINLRYPLLVYLHKDEIFIHSIWHSPLQSNSRSYVAAATSNDSLLHHRFTFINASDGESQLKQYLTNHLYDSRTSTSTSFSVAVCSIQKDVYRSAFIYNAIHHFDDMLETMKVIIDDRYVDGSVDNVNDLMRCRQAMEKDLTEGKYDDRSIQHAPLTYKINLVLASEQQQQLSGQQQQQLLGQQQQQQQSGQQQQLSGQQQQQLLHVGRQHNQAYDVVTKQLIRSIDQLLVSSSGLHTHVHVYKRRLYSTGLIDRYRYRYRTGHQSNTSSPSSSHTSSGSQDYSIRYLSPGDVLQYMESDESIYHQSSVVGSGECTRPQLCTEFTIVYYAPSYSHDDSTDDAPSYSHDDSTDNEDASHRGPHGGHPSMHIVDDPQSIISYSDNIDRGDNEDIEQQQQQHDYPSSGVINPHQHGCFIVFDFNDLPEILRNSHLHSVMDLSLQCLRRILGIPMLPIPTAGVHSRVRDRGKESPPYVFSRSEIDLFVQRSVDRTRRAMHTCMRQSLELQGIHRLSSSNDSPPIDVLRQVMASIQLIASNSFGPYRSILDEYYQLLKDYESFDDELSNTIMLSCLHHHYDEESCGGSALTRQMMMTRREELWSQLRSVHRSCQQLATSPDGSLASRIQLPSELYFAVYGPYWLPLLLPAFRLIRTYL